MKPDIQAVLLGLLVGWLVAETRKPASAAPTTPKPTGSVSIDFMGTAEFAPGGGSVNPGSGASGTW